MDSKEVIVAQKLGKSFSGVSVLSNVDLALRSGEVHAIVGENGAGKSTLAKLFGGVFQQTEGEIILDGVSVRFPNPRASLEQGVALIHQEPMVFPNLSVAENVFVGNQPSRPGLRTVDWKEMHSVAAALFASLGVNLDTHRTAGGLSVADQQMIELASALNHRAKVVLFDETTASLTPKEVSELFTVIRRLKTQGCAIAIVTHRLDEVFEISDRISVLRDGAKISESLTSKTTVDTVVHDMVGRAFSTSTDAGDALSPGEVLLEVTGLELTGIFQDIGFQVRAGEIVGLAGLVGAGRTEVCEAIFGVRKLTKGSIRFKDREVKIRNPRDAIDLGIGMTPEDRQHHGLILPFGIAENISLASIMKFSVASWLDSRKESEVARQEATAVDVKFHRLSQSVSELSGGNQQKVVFAKWLLTQPKLLILDEPTRGVDVRAKDNIHRHIFELARVHRLGILVVSSDLSEVLSLSDQVLVMRSGRLQTRLSREEATAERIMMAAAGTVKIAS
jgi:rhamnose transport system ATP-binding protein